jgi:glycosyltransferase involved in cell wall biosynthesis
MSRLARHHDVVFVNPSEPLTRYATKVRWRLWRLLDRCETVEGEALTLFTPLDLPGRNLSRATRAADEWWAGRQLRRLVRWRPGAPLVLFLGNPWRVHLLDALPEAQCTLYHCSDNFPALFAGDFRQQFEEREGRLIRSVDLCLCSHPSLVGKCQALGGRACYFEHAVDVRFFPPARRDGLPECPADLVEIPRPRVVFVGTLDAGLDYDLLIEAARHAAALSFVFIGPVDPRVADAVEALGVLPNVRCLGPRPWEALPRYLWHMDVGVIPFVVDEYNASGSPLKLFEYLAAGLPVVTTKPWCPARLEDFVRRATGPDDFAAALRGATAEPPCPAYIGEQLGTMRKHYTWRIRAAELAALVSTSLETDPDE